jgi:signal recognition particle subunit SRP54
MGNMKDILNMIPGMKKMGNAANQMDDKMIGSIEAIIYSMTQKERENPDIINGTRKARIAKGSGTSIQQVNNLMNQFDQMRKMIKKMNKGGMPQLDNMFK